MVPRLGLDQRHPTVRPRLFHLKFRGTSNRTGGRVCRFTVGTGVSSGSLTAPAYDILGSDEVGVNPEITRQSLLPPEIPDQ